MENKNKIDEFRWVEKLIKNNLGEDVIVKNNNDNNLFITSNQIISLSEILQLKNDLNSWIWDDFIVDFNESVQFSENDGREISNHNIICLENFREKNILLDENTIKKIQSFIDQNIKTKMMIDLLNLNNILVDLFEEKINIFKNLELKKSQKIYYDQYFNEKYSEYFNKFQDLILKKGDEIKELKTNIIGDIIKSNWRIDFQRELNLMSSYFNEETEEYTFRIRIFKSENIKEFIDQIHSYFLKNLGFKNTLTKIEQIDEKTLEFSGLKLANNNYILDRKELSDIIKFGKYKDEWYAISNYIYFEELFEICITNRKLCKELIGANYLYFGTYELKNILFGKYSKISEDERKIRSLKLSFLLRDTEFSDDINKEEMIKIINKYLNLNIDISQKFSEDFLDEKRIIIDIYDQKKCRFTGELNFDDKEDFKRFINSINSRGFGFSIRGVDD